MAADTTSDLPALAPVIFILGAPRSGTTLLRVMMEGHSKLFSPPEMVLAPFETMEERASLLTERYWEKGGLRRAIMELAGVGVDDAKATEASLRDKTIPEAYAWLQSHLGGRTLVDKCPHLSIHPDALERLKAWIPEAQFIWISRHPGSVIRSLQNMPMAEVMLQGYDSGPEELWLRSNNNYKSFLETIPEGRKVHVRYEDIVADPKAAMERVCGALGLDYEAGMAKPYEGERMKTGPRGARAIGDPNMAGRGKIQPELADKWLKGFDPTSVSDETRALALELGYDLSAMELPPTRLLSDQYQRLFKMAMDLERSIDLPMELDSVEGRRFLFRMLSQSVDLFVEQGDYHRPRFFHAEGPHRKMFGDNPDADYLRAPIQTKAGQVYRVSGVIPEGTLYTSVLLYGRGGRVGNSLIDDALQTKSDGSFEVMISTEPQEGTWLKADGDENAIIVRQYFKDRSTEAPITVNIEYVGEVGAKPPMDAKSTLRQLQLAERMLKAIFDRTLQAYEMVRTLALKRFVEIPADQLFPTPDNRYRVCWYRLGPDQLMLIRGRVPKSRYFSFVLYNVWLESYDYTAHQVCLNDEQMSLGEGDTYEICLSHKDLGHPNWLDTAGHLAGYVCERVLLPGEEPPDIEVEVLYEREYAARNKG